jgi:hypothetical protein
MIDHHVRTIARAADDRTVSAMAGVATNSARAVPWTVFSWPVS